MAALGAVAVREAYDYLAGVTSEIGQSAWIATSIIITEAMICYGISAFLEWFIMAGCYPRDLYKDVKIYEKNLSNPSKKSRKKV